MGLQVLALFSAAVLVIVKALTETSESLAGALLLAAGALFCVGALVVCVRGILRLRPVARAPVVVIELLAVPVGYHFWFSTSQPAYGAPILISALAVLFLLFSPPARAVLDRPDPPR